MKINQEAGEEKKNFIASTSGSSHRLGMRPSRSDVKSDITPPGNCNSTLNMKEIPPLQKMWSHDSGLKHAELKKKKRTTKKRLLEECRADGESD